MTVTEMREALQRLEAEGKGALPVTYNYMFKGHFERDEVDLPFRACPPDKEFPEFPNGFIDIN